MEPSTRHGDFISNIFNHASVSTRHSAASMPAGASNSNALAGTVQDLTALILPVLQPLCLSHA